MNARLGLTALVVIAALVALGMSAWLYLQPLSGVTGAPGPLLAGVGALSIVLGSLILMALSSGGLHGLVAFLILLAAVLTGIAGFFLLSWVIVVSMIVVFLAQIGALAAPSRPTRTA